MQWIAVKLGDGKIDVLPFEWRNCEYKHTLALLNRSAHVEGVAIVSTPESGSTKSLKKEAKNKAAVAFLSNNSCKKRNPETKVYPSGELMEATYKKTIMALEKHNYVQDRAAKELQISPRVMNSIIKKFGIKHDKWYKNK